MYFVLFDIIYKKLKSIARILVLVVLIIFETNQQRTITN